MSCWKWFWESRCNNLPGNEPTPPFRYHTSKWPWALWAQSRQFSTTEGIFDSGYRKSLTETTVRVARGATKITVHSLYGDSDAISFFSTRVTGTVPTAFNPLLISHKSMLFNAWKLFLVVVALVTWDHLSYALKQAYSSPLFLLLLGNLLKKESGHCLQVTWYCACKILKTPPKHLKLQDTKLIHRNLLHFYALTMNYQKEKQKKQLHLLSHKK